MVTRITNVSGPVVTVDSLGPDANLGFLPQQWVELTDDGDEFGQRPNQPGQLLQIASLGPGPLDITLTQPAPALNTANGHAKLRRWDQAGTDATPNGVPMHPAGPNILESGIFVQFSPNQPFSSGDYWLVPARTATGAPEWPPSDSDGAEYQPAHTTLVHRAPLACIHFNANAGGFTVESCRDIFSPLTEITPVAVPPALHVSAINWPNDDIFTLDQLLFQGLTVTLDAAPADTLDAAIFIVKLEIPFAGGGSEATVVGIASGATGGVLRLEAVLDGGVSVSAANNAIAWKLGRNLFGTLAQLADAQAALADSGEFIRARVILKGHAIRSASAATPMFLDGQCFGTLAKRADSTPRTDLTFPSGNGVKASDFESWFYLAPIQRLENVTVAPAKVAFVVARSPIIRLGVKLVDNTAGHPDPNSPAVVPTVTMVLHYNALADTTVLLTVSGGTPGIVQAPPRVTVPRGAKSPATAVQLSVRNPGAVTQTFTVTASLILPSGQQTNASATIEVTGVAAPGTGPIFTPGPITGPILSALTIDTPSAPPPPSPPDRKG